MHGSAVAQNPSCSLGEFLCREEITFELRFLLSSMAGADAFTHVFFETRSGNIYLIAQPRFNSFLSRLGFHKELTNPRHSDFLLYNGRHNRGRVRLSGYDLTRFEMNNKILRVGERFSYGLNGETEPLTRITCVNLHRQYATVPLQEMTGGRKSSVLERFIDLLTAGGKV